MDLVLLLGIYLLINYNLDKANTDVRIELDFLNKVFTPLLRKDSIRESQLSFMLIWTLKNGDLMAKREYCQFYFKNISS